MKQTRSTTEYGLVSIATHWSIAVAIFTMLALGFTASFTSDSKLQAVLLRLHVPLGLTILFLTIWRFAWNYIWARTLPSFQLPRWQVLAAQANHLLLYVIIFAICGSGIALVAKSGASNTLLGAAGNTPIDFKIYAPMVGHVIGVFILIALLVLHISAALWHQLLLRDRLLARMGVGRRPNND